MSTPLKINCRNCHARLDVSDFEPFTFVECPQCGAKLRVPLPFGRYQLEKVCGAGGTSRIYRAIDPVLARRVAVKIITDDDSNTGLAARFQEEAKLVAKLNHPGIVPIYDCGKQGEYLFLVMQFMEKGDLELPMKHHQLPEPVVLLKYLSEVAAALEYARRFKVVHHDVKPSNMLISDENEAKISDFDLADVRESGDTATPCAQWGSPGYVSPERLLHGGEDWRGDVFSLGVSIYELFSGVTPYGITGTPKELYQKRREEKFQPLNELNAKVSRELAAITAAMIDFSPECRPDYRQIIATLEQERARLASSGGAERWTGRISDWFKK